MLMIQIGKDFCDEVSSEEWTRRLRKLAVKTKVRRAPLLQELGLIEHKLVLTASH